MNDYRMKIKKNFFQRAEILSSFEMETNTVPKTKFDDILEETSMEISDMNLEFQRYVKLKSEESWLDSLIKQKEN